MNRRNQMWLLIALSATTAIMQYVVQGALATAHDPAEFGRVFWLVDYGLWGARAIIEAMVIAYLFQTTAKTRLQEATLLFFEGFLIALIILTLGPALRAMGLGVTMVDSLSPVWFTLWNFGIAAYTPLMMGGAAFAYKVQNEERKPVIITGTYAERCATLIEQYPEWGATRLAEEVGCSIATASRAISNGKGNHA